MRQNGCIYIGSIGGKLRLYLVTISFIFLISCLVSYIIQLNWTSRYQKDFLLLEKRMRNLEDYLKDRNLSWRGKNQDDGRREKPIMIAANYTKGSKFYNSCYVDTISSLFPKTNVASLNKEEIDTYIKTRCLIGVAQPCPLSQLKGPFKVSSDAVSLEHLYKNELQFVHHGGWWSPSQCTKTKMIAVVIPNRGRDEHLAILLRHLHPILKRQMIHYRIFVINQDDKDNFNKGKLFNAGFIEIRRLFPYNCIVFHDVDLIPEDDRINYSCEHSPNHLAAAVSTFNYILFSDKLFGGVVSFKPSDYIKINGFSNLFWVWGGEDDNLYERVLLNGLKPHRENISIARYTMLKHVSREQTRSKADYQEMLRDMKLAREHSQEDGLNSVSYHVTGIILENLYTLIKVDLLKSYEKNLF